jgi:hypothetical protein
MDREPRRIADAAQAAQCDRYGVKTLEEVLRIKIREGLTLADALMAMVQEQIDAEDAERKVSRELAEKVTCPYCGAEPGVVCRRMRGQQAGSDLDHWSVRSFRSKDWHQTRFHAAVAAGAAELLDGAS